MLPFAPSSGNIAQKTEAPGVLGSCHFLELFGSSLLYLIGDNFDAQELQKSISKKAENEIVLSPADGRVDDAQIELDRPARHEEASWSSMYKAVG